MRLFYGEQWRQQVIDVAQHIIKTEVAQYSSNNNNILRKVDTHSLMDFDIQKAYTEYRRYLPYLTDLLAHCLPTDKQPSVTMSNIPGFTTSLSKYLALASNRMSAYRYVYSSLLVSGGTKAATIDMLAKSYDTMSYSSVLQQQNNLANTYIDRVERWQATDAHYCITFDNLDKHMRARHSTTSSKNKMVNMVHAIAFKSRVIPPSNLPATPVVMLNDVKPSDLLPFPADLESIRQDLSYHLRQIIADNIPALAWMRPQSAYLRHQHTESLSSVTEQVLLKGYYFCMRCSEQSHSMSFLQHARMNTINIALFEGIPRRYSLIL
jgi:hypothetical protein